MESLGRYGKVKLAFTGESAGRGTCELPLGGLGGAGQVEYRGREARAKASKGVRALRAWRTVGCPRSRWPDVGAKEWAFLCKIMGTEAGDRQRQTFIWMDHLESIWETDLRVSPELGDLKRDCSGLGKRGDRA